MRTHAAAYAVEAWLRNAVELAKLRSTKGSFMWVHVGIYIWQYLPFPQYLQHHTGTTVTSNLNQAANIAWTGEVQFQALLPSVRDDVC